MSRDKSTAKRLYKVRGAETKRKLKLLKARSSPAGKPGHTFVTFCPECERPVPIAIGSEDKKASCKAGHTWEII